MIIAETKKLFLRELTYDDYDNLSLLFHDRAVFYYYDRTFTEQDIKSWLDAQLHHYRSTQTGRWAVISKDDGGFVGHAGLVYQRVGQESLLDMNYLLLHKYWHMGYADDIVKLCKRYAYEVLGTPSVYSIVRSDDIASQRVLKKADMTLEKTFTAHRNDEELTFFIYQGTDQITKRRL